MPDTQTDKSQKNDSIVSISRTKTAVGDIDTITVAPQGETEVDLPEGAGDGGVVVADKVAPREAADDDNPNLSDDVGAAKPGKGEKKPFKRTRDGRIDHYRKLAGDYERTAEDYKRELEEERAKAKRLEEEKRLSDYAAVMHYNDALKANRDKLTRDLRDAKDKADSETEAKITAELATVAANLSNVEGWLKSNPKPEPIAKAAPSPKADEEETADRRPTAQQKPVYKGEAARWVQENPWFEEGSQDYDSAMANAAKNYATYIEGELAREGRQNLIGSPQYFDAIDARMRQMFPDRFGDDEGDGDAEDPPPPPRKAGNGGVLPARGNGNPGGVQRQQPNANPNRVVLSQEQREIAHSLILKHPDGRPFSPKEKEIKYAEGLRNTTRKGA